MALRIFKYELTPEHPIQMPQGAKLLSVGAQRDEKRFVWALVDDQAPLVLRDLRLLYTGNHVSRGVGAFMTFVGTIHTMGGALVTHVMDMGEVPPDRPRRG